MRNLALSIATVLVLAVVSPAVAQPFADVPTDHWAFDAIAELAAKGVIEGYPDGTFKGDRGITRYEVAMIVARILARIEAIKVPAPAAPAAPPAAAPPAAVTPAQVQTIQRLVNEFRAELAALGVRVTAVEEELAALKQTTTTVRVTGDTRLRYRMWGTGEAAGGATSAADPRWRNRLKFTAKPASNVTAYTELLVGVETGNTFALDTVVADDVTVEYSYVDATAFGIPWRLGAQDGTLGNGLLFGGDPVGGLKGTLSFAGFNFEPAGYADGTNNYWTLRASTSLAGWDVGASYYSERPPGAAESTGYGVDLSGNLFGLSFMADYASYDLAGATPAETAWKAQFDLGEMMGLGLTVWYKNYGTTGTVAPASPAGFSGTEIFESFTWNFKGWGAMFTTSFAGWDVDLRYETGERVSAPGAVNVYYLALGTPLASNTSLLLTYRKQEGAGAVAGAVQETQYRVQVEVTY